MASALTSFLRDGGVDWQSYFYLDRYEEPDTVDKAWARATGKDAYWSPYRGDDEFEPDPLQSDALDAELTSEGSSLRDMFDGGDPDQGGDMLSKFLTGTLDGPTRDMLVSQARKPRDLLGSGGGRGGPGLDEETLAAAEQFDGASADAGIGGGGLWGKLRHSVTNPVSTTLDSLARVTGVGPAFVSGLIGADTDLDDGTIRRAYKLDERREALTDGDTSLEGQAAATAAGGPFGDVQELLGSIGEGLSRARMSLEGEEMGFGGVSAPETYRDDGSVNPDAERPWSLRSTSDDSVAADVGKKALSFGGDVVADPLSWLTLGTAGTSAKAGAVGTDAVLRGAAEGGGMQAARAAIRESDSLARSLANDAHRGRAVQELSGEAGEELAGRTMAEVIGSKGADELEDLAMSGFINRVSSARASRGVGAARETIEGTFGQGSKAADEAWQLLYETPGLARRPRMSFPFSDRMGVNLTGNGGAQSGLARALNTPTFLADAGAAARKGIRNLPLKGGTIGGKLAGRTGEVWTKAADASADRADDAARRWGEFSDVQAADEVARKGRAALADEDNLQVSKIRQAIMRQPTPEGRRQAHEATSIAFDQRGRMVAGEGGEEVWDAEGILDDLVADGIDEDAARAGLQNAAELFDVYDRVGRQVLRAHGGDTEAATGFLNKYVPRLLSEASQESETIAGRAMSQVRSVAGKGRGTSGPLKARTGRWGKWGVDDDGALTRVGYMSPKEIAEAEGTEVFETDALAQLEQYLAATQHVRDTDVLMQAYGRTGLLGRVGKTREVAFNDVTRANAVGPVVDDINSLIGDLEDVDGPDALSKMLGDRGVNVDEAPLDPQQWFDDTVEVNADGDLFVDGTDRWYVVEKSARPGAEAEAAAQSEGLGDAVVETVGRWADDVADDGPTRVVGMLDGDVAGAKHTVVRDVVEEPFDDTFGQAELAGAVGPEAAEQIELIVDGVPAVRPWIAEVLADGKVAVDDPGLRFPARLGNDVSPMDADSIVANDAAEKFVAALEGAGWTRRTTTPLDEYGTAQLAEGTPGGTLGRWVEEPMEVLDAPDDWDADGLTDWFTRRDPSQVPPVKLTKARRGYIDGALEQLPDDVAASIARSKVTWDSDQVDQLKQWITGDKDLFDVAADVGIQYDTVLSDLDMVREKWLRRPWNYNWDSKRARQELWGDYNALGDALELERKGGGNAQDLLLSGEQADALADVIEAAADAAANKRQARAMRSTVYDLRRQGFAGRARRGATGEGPTVRRDVSRVVDEGGNEVGVFDDAAEAERLAGELSQGDVASPGDMERVLREAVADPDRREEVAQLLEAAGERDGARIVRDWTDPQAEQGWRLVDDLGEDVAWSTDRDDLVDGLFAEEQAAARVDALESARDDAARALVEDRDFLLDAVSAETLGALDGPEQTEYIQSIIRTMSRATGRTTDDVAQELTATRTIPDALAEELAGDGWRKLASQGMLGERVERLWGNFAPELVAKTLSAQLAPDPESWGVLLASINTIFKAQATSGRGPGYIARNVMGGMQNGINVGTQADDWRDAARIVRAKQWALRKTRKEVGEAADIETQRDVFRRNMVGRLEDSHGKDDGQSLWFTFEHFSDSPMAGQSRAMEQMIGLGAGGIDTSKGVFRRLRGKQTSETDALDRILKGQPPAAQLKPSQRVARKFSDLAWMRFWNRQSETSEEFLRLGVYRGGMREHGTDNAGRILADLRVKASQFDYTDLSPTEQRLVGSVIPFYSWTRNNLPLQTRLLLKKPRYVNILQELHETAVAHVNPTDQPDTGRDDRVPEWMEERFGFDTGLRLPGMPEDASLSLGIETPFSDILRWTSTDGNTFEAASGELVGSLHPVPKTAIEQTFGIDSFTGAEFQEVEDAPAWARLIPGATEKSLTGQRVADPRLLQGPRNLLPWLGMADRLGEPTADVVTGRGEATDPYRDRLSTSWLATLGGVPAATITDKTVSGQAYYAERDLLDELEKMGLPSQVRYDAVEVLPEGASPDAFRAMWGRAQESGMDAAEFFARLDVDAEAVRDAEREAEEAEGEE